MLVDLNPSQVAILRTDRVLGTLRVWPEEADRQMLLRALAIAALDAPGFDYALSEIAKQIRGGPGDDGTALYEEFKRLNADRWKIRRTDLEAR